MSSLVQHVQGFLDKDRAEFILDKFSTHIPWTTFGPAPRSRKVWRWDKISTGDAVIDGIIAELIFDLQKQHNVKVHGIFCNLYQNGNDYCPYHSDTYGYDVWTLSLGATRDVLVKANGTGTRAEKWTLKSGDLYFMPEILHKGFKHSIPIRKGCTGSRISIVFFTSKK